MKYESSTVFSNEEIAIMKKDSDFEKNYSLPNGYPIYPNVRIEKLITPAGTLLGADTFIIKELDGVKYLWYITEKMEFPTDEYTKELENFKNYLHQRCLRISEISINKGIVNTNLVFADGQPVFERLDKYVSID